MAALKGVVSPGASQSMMVIIWQPMLASLWTEALGMLAALYLSKQKWIVFGRDLHPPAFVFNVIAIGFYLCAPAALVPYFALAANRTIHKGNLYSDFRQHLEEQAAAWTGGSFAFDSVSTELLIALQTTVKDFLNYLANGFLVFCILTIIAAVAFFPAAWFYLALLRSHMTGKSPSVTSAHSGKSQDRIEALAVS